MVRPVGLLYCISLAACATAEQRAPMTEWTVTTGTPLRNWMPLSGGPPYPFRPQFLSLALDVDADGDLDLVRAGDRDYAGVVRNDGNLTGGSFKPYETLVSLADFDSGDFNADGYPDLVCMAGGNDWQAFVLWNDRSGHYGDPEYILTLPRRVESVAIINYDKMRGDELLIVLMDSVTDGSSPKVLQWTAGWRQVASGPEIGFPDEILAIGDLDGDARHDVFMSGGKAWLQSNADMLEPATVLQRPWRAQACADLNGDGRLEILAEKDGWLHLVQLSEDGGIESLPLVELIGVPSLVFDDLDADGQIDILLLEHSYPRHRFEDPISPSRYSAFFGRQYGFEWRCMPFEPRSNFPLPDLVADFDGDRLPDLLFLTDHPGIMRMVTNAFDQVIPQGFSFQTVAPWPSPGQ